MREERERKKAFFSMKKNISFFDLFSSSSSATADGGGVIIDVFAVKLFDSRRQPRNSILRKTHFKNEAGK